jgi:hypothetical protein
MFISRADGIRPGDDDMRPIATYVTRTESGAATNYWEQETALQMLYKLARVRSF